MYEELREHNDKFSSSAKYFASINKITLGNNKLLLERFRFNKQHKLIFFCGEYILTEKDEEFYKKYLDIYNNK